MFILTMNHPPHPPTVHRHKTMTMQPSTNPTDVMPVVPTKVIHLFCPHSRRFVPLTQVPLTKLLLFPMPLLALQFGIYPLLCIIQYQIDQRLIPVINLDIQILLYGMLWLVYTTNCSNPPNFLACCLYFQVLFVDGVLSCLFCSSCCYLHSFTLVKIDDHYPDEWYD